VPTLLSGPERVDQIKQILTVSFKRSLFMLLLSSSKILHCTTTKQEYTNKY
jgi:hypothetical protein